MYSEALNSGQRSTKIQELMEKASPDMKEIFREKIAESNLMEESMRSEEAAKQELEKVRNILSEVNEHLKDKNGYYNFHLWRLDILHNRYLHYVLFIADIKTDGMK